MHPDNRARPATNTIKRKGAKKQDRKVFLVFASLRLGVLALILIPTSKSLPVIGI
jgi:hypothetical protein